MIKTKSDHIYAPHFLLLVKRCSKLESAEELHAFVELRQLSWDTPLEQQAKQLCDKLNKAVREDKGCILNTLCAIGMLIRHGKAGLLDAIMSPENLRSLEVYFQPGWLPVKVETQHLLAGHIKVSFTFGSEFIPI